MALLGQDQWKMSKGREGKKEAIGRKLGENDAEI
jgi:hypothetical protein